MKTDHILFGAAYYAEYLPYNRIEKDMQMMKNAGMNTIRIAESTWSTLEPSEGVYDFSYLDSMLETSNKYGIQVIVGTPTYAIPAWLARKSGDILAITHQGQELYGHRQNMDIVNPIYLKHCEQIIRVLMEHVHPFKNIIGFQLDNETKAYDTCSHYAQEKFREYLLDKFSEAEYQGDTRSPLDRINEHFGLNYWSNRINTPEDLTDIRGTINGSLGGEYQKFQRKLVTDFLAWQAAIVSEYKGPEQFLTQNFDFDWRGFSYGQQPNVNQYQAARPLSVAGVDIYHESEDKLTGTEISFGGAIARSLKNNENYLVLETQAQGNPGWLPFDKQLRLQAYSHIASGSNSVMYWHWHSIHNSLESYWKGVLSHDFGENRTYHEAAVIGREFEALGSQLKNLTKKNKAAFLLDNESLTGIQWFSMDGNCDYNRTFRLLYDTFYRLNLECDVIYKENACWKDYDLIIIPALYSASEGLLTRLKEYTAAGGNILATYRTAFTDEYLKIYSDTQPHILHECFGMHYDEFTLPQHVRLYGSLLQEEKGEIYQDNTETINNPSERSTKSGSEKTMNTPSSYVAEHFMELLQPDDAETWLAYDHPTFGKYAAVTHNRYYKGTATYLGCDFATVLLEKVIRKLLCEISLDRAPYHFPIIKKSGYNDRKEQINYYFNYSSEDKQILYDGNAGRSLLHSHWVDHGDTLLLHAWDLDIIVESTSKSNSSVDSNDS